MIDISKTKTTPKRWIQHNEWAALGMSTHRINSWTLFGSLKENNSSYK